MRLAEDRTNEVLHAIAELKTDNESYHQRIEAEAGRRFEKRRERLLLSSVQTLESLDDAIHAAQEGGAAEALVEGVRLVRSQLFRLLQEEGLQRVSVLGLPFDGETSEVVGRRTVEDESQDGLVVEEVASGQQLGGRVVRRAKVVLGRHAPAEEQAEEEAPTVILRAPAGKPAAPEEPAIEVAEEEGAYEPTAVMPVVPAGEAPPETVALPAVVDRQEATVAMAAAPAGPPRPEATPERTPEPEPEPEPTVAMPAVDEEPTTIRMAAPTPAVPPEPEPEIEESADDALDHADPTQTLPFVSLAQRERALRLVREMQRDRAKAAVAPPEPTEPPPPPPTVVAPPPAEPAPVAARATAPEPPRAPRAPRPAPPAPPPVPVAAPPPVPVAAPPPAASAAPAEPAAPRAPSRRGLYAGLGVAILVLLAIFAFEIRLLLAPSPRPAAPVASPEAASVPPAPSTMAAAPVTTVRPAAATPAPAVSPVVAPSPPQVRMAAAPPPVTVAPRALPPPTVAGPPARATAPPTTTPAAPPVAATVATLVGQADRATAAGNHDEAVRLYDQALQLDPRSAEAASGRARAVAARDLARRAFVTAATTVETPGSAGKSLSGFETSDVKVTKAPKFSGKLDFEVSPRPPVPGAPYAVAVFLVNTGSKDFKVASLVVTYSVNGTAETETLTPKAREVAPGKRVEVGSLSGVWREGTTSWSLGAVVTAPGGESFRSQVTWR